MPPATHWRFTTRTGRRVLLRPVHPDDAAPLGQMFESLSPLARRWRFHGAVNGLPPHWLQQMAGADGHRCIAIVATVEHEGRELLVADARCVTDASDSAAEFAIAVAEGWRGLGIARRCLAALRTAAADEGLRWLYGHVMADNLPMVALVRRQGFTLTPHRANAGLLVAETRLPALATQAWTSQPPGGHALAAAVQ